MTWGPRVCDAWAGMQTSCLPSVMASHEACHGFPWSHLLNVILSQLFADWSSMKLFADGSTTQTIALLNVCRERMWCQYKSMPISGRWRAWFYSPLDTCRRVWDLSDSLATLFCGLCFVLIIYWSLEILLKQDRFNDSWMLGLYFSNFYLLC